MLDKEKQIKNSFIYLLPAVVTGLLPIVTLPIFTRILTVQDYGVLALAQIYAVFVSGLANFGMSVSYNRNFFQYKEKQSELFYSTLAFVGTTFFTLGFVTYLFRFNFSEWIIGSSDYGNILFFAYCSFGILTLKGYYLTYLKNSEDAKKYAFYAISESILAIILSLIFVVYFRKGVVGIVLGQLFAGSIFFLILIVKFLDILPVAFNGLILKDSLKLSYPLTPRVFLKTIETQFDKYMLGLMASIGNVGIYSIGQKIAHLIFIIMTAVENVFSPQVYKRMFDLGKDGGRAIGTYLTPFIYISIAFAIALVLFVEEIVAILMPKSYHGVIDIVIVLSMFYGFTFFRKQPQLIFAKKTHIVSILTFVNLVLNIALNIPFIIKWGSIGAAWATFLVGLIFGSITFVISQHHYNIQWEYKKVGSIFFVFFSSAILMVLLREFMVNYEIRLFIKSISMGIYIYMGMKFNIITKANYFLIKSSISLKTVAYTKSTN